jgi:3-hydroxybutyryl-CoA dehydrogenase
MKKIRKVAVIGTGTLGTQIALQASSHGYDVATYDVDEKAFERTLEVLRKRMENSRRETSLRLEVIQREAPKIYRGKNLEDTLRSADLAIEAVPEDLPLKRNVFTAMDAAAPGWTILATNSSSLPVSRMESATHRPEKCLNLHFYGLDAGKNIVDVMGGNQTSSDVLETGKQWVRSIGCIPLLVKKESLGFCFNRVWRAVKRETLHMWAEGFVDFQDIDRAWMVWTGMSQGPFGIMDAIGLDVVYGIEMVYFNESKDPRDFPPPPLREIVERKELGVKTGKGFYSYPDPEYRSPDFLRGK